MTFAQKYAILSQSHQQRDENKMPWQKRAPETTAPESYLNERRPPFHEALATEGLPFNEAMESLKRKGYFTPKARPWQLGYQDRGLGSGDYAVLDRYGDVVAEKLSREDAEFIIAAANAHTP